MIDERTCLIVVVTVQLGSIPTLGEETGDTTANNRVVELIGQVTGNNFLACCIEFSQALGIVVNVDIIYYAVVYTLRNISIACERSARLSQRIDFQTVTSVNLINHTEFEGRIQEMVCITYIGSTCMYFRTQISKSECIECRKSRTTEIALRVQFFRRSCIHLHQRGVCEIPSTSVEHLRSTLHHAVVQLESIVEVHFVEIPLILEPNLRIAHIDVVVVAETTVGSTDEGCVIPCNLVLTNFRDLFLRETAVGSQFLDITICKGVYINPLTSTEQVINRLVVNTLREFTFYAESHLQMLILRVDIVERSNSLLDVIVTALQDITCGSVRT